MLILADFGWKAAKWPGGPNSVESFPDVPVPASDGDESEEEADPDECCGVAPVVKIGYPGP